MTRIQPRWWCGLVGSLPLLLLTQSSPLLGGSTPRTPAGPGPEHVAAVLQQARELLDGGEFNAALLMLQGMREAAGDQPPILVALGDTYARVRLWRESAQFYRRAAAADSTFAPAWAGLGRVLFETQKTDSALSALERAVSLHPREIGSLGLLGELALERGDFDTALQSFQKILALEGETLDALTDLAVVHERRGEWEAARSLLRRAAELYPRRSEAHYNLAVLESQAGRFHEAVLAANEALALAPDSTEILRFLGVLYFENQVCSEAVRYFSEVLASNPLDVDVRIGLASCLHALGRSDEGVRELQTVLTQSKQDYDVLLLMADIRLEQNQLREALSIAQRAADLDTLRPDAYYLLGLAWRRLGREDEAGRSFERLERLRQANGREKLPGPPGVPEDAPR